MSIIYNLLVTTCLLLSFNKKITSETCLIAFFLSMRKYMLFYIYSANILIIYVTMNFCLDFFTITPPKKILYHYYCSSNAACMLRIKPAYLARFTADPLNNLR